MLQSKLLTFLSFLFSLAVVSAVPFFSSGSLWRRLSAVDPRSLPEAETKNSCGAVPSQKVPATVSRVQQADPKANENPSVMQTLPPNVHWTTNTKTMANVAPVAAEKDSKMYYGSSDASEAGYYGWMIYRFNMPSVNLDHSDKINFQFTQDKSLKMTFTDAQAFQSAKTTWKADDKGLLLIADVKDCAVHSDDDRCFFNAKGLTVDDASRSIVAKGAAVDPQTVMTDAESNWGWHTPKGGDDGKVKARFFSPRFATASPGPSFDEDLDNKIGFSGLSSDSKAFLDSVFPAGRSPAPKTCGNPAVLRRRGMFSWIRDDAGLPIAASDAHSLDRRFLDINKDFSKDFDWNIPQPDDQFAKHASPFGDSILLFSGGAEQDAPGGSKASEHIDVFCVGCSASGHATISGAVKFSPFSGLKEGHVDVKADMDVTIKIGIDAQLKLKKDFDMDLFNVGLPGLSFGPVSLGPFIDVKSHVGLEAAANGKLLVGAEVGVKDATATLDLVNHDNTKAENWDPSFKPTVEADGEIKLSATAGLPVGLKVGFKIAKIVDKSIGLIDEPSLKAVAQIAASIGLDDDGGFSGGLKESNGCKGIATTLSFRNTLSIDIFGAFSKTLIDSGDKDLANGCINLANQPDTPEPPFSNSTAQARSIRRRAAPCDIKQKQVFTRDLGFNLSPLVGVDGKSMAISCDDGNIYAAAKGSGAAKTCSTEWAKANDATIGFDGAMRSMHFYSDTMEAVGVSRLRVSAPSKTPKNAVAAVMVPVKDAKGASVYAVAGPNKQVFYPAVCDFTDGSPSKVFLAKDLSTGLDVLKGADVADSVTGGKVKGCFPLALAASA